MSIEPELSIVVTSRNDDHGGNLKKRMRLCFNGIFALSARHKLKCELIIVEWNPPAGKPKLAEILPWPDEHSYCTVRIIEVPSELHGRYKHAAGLPLYQMIAKNVGIRRARGRMVLATNIDILFTDAMFAFLASGEAKRDVMYRCDRHDTDGDIPEDADIDTQLRIARETTLRIGGWGGTWNLRTGTYSIVNATWADPGGTQSSRHPVHTNASGDFTMMARDNWFELRGHWETDAYSFHLDSILCYAAVYGGITEECLRAPLWCHHIEHTAGWTPEINAAGTLDNHLKKVAVPKISNEELDKICRDMSRLSRPLFGPNDDNWGLAGDVLTEHVVARARWEDWPVAPGTILASRAFPAVPSRFARKALLDEAAADRDGVPYISVIAIRRDPARDALWQRNLESACSGAGLRTEIILVDGATGVDAAARNEAATRARGTFVLFMEPGVMPANKLVALLAERRLNPDCFYRVGNGGAAEVLSADPLAPLAVDGCEDFLLIARALFIRLRGFPDVKGAARRSCALLLNMAHAEGFTQVMLHMPLAISRTDTAGGAADTRTDKLDRAWCEAMMRQRRSVTRNRPIISDEPVQESWAHGLVETFGDHLMRVYFREQTPETLIALRKIVSELRPDRIMEIGVGYGLSIRASLKGGARITVVEPDLSRFRMGLEIDPIDTAAIRTVETDLDRLQLDMLWKNGERLLVVVNPHLLDETGRQTVWTRLVPELPAGSTVIVTSTWLSPHRLDAATIQPFFSNFVIQDIDPTYCFDAGYADHWAGGTLVGEGDIRAFTSWINRTRIPIEAPGGRNFIVFQMPALNAGEQDVGAGCAAGGFFYNPAAGWRWTAGEFTDLSIRRITDLCKSGEQSYRAGNFGQAVSQFSQAILLYERMTWGAQEFADKMIAADDRGDRGEALRHFTQWQAMIAKIGVLEGVKRILVCCALRNGDPKGALSMPHISHTDFVEPSVLDPILFLLVRTGVYLSESVADEGMATA
jgi:hypothetical protein